MGMVESARKLLLLMKKIISNDISLSKRVSKEQISLMDYCRLAILNHENVLEGFNTYTGGKRDSTFVVKCRSVNLKEIIDKAISFSHVECKIKNITVRTWISNAVPTSMRCIEGHVLKCVDNLLANAVKFSHPNGMVTINATIQDSMVTVDFRDHGCGIRAKNLKRIFEYGERGVHPEIERSTIGRGVGLYVARKLARNMGGDVLVKATKLGVGTTFRLTFKCEKTN